MRTATLPACLFGPGLLNRKHDLVFEPTPLIYDDLALRGFKKANETRVLPFRSASDRCLCAEERVCREGAGRWARGQGEKTALRFSGLHQGNRDSLPFPMRSAYLRSPFCCLQGREKSRP